MSSAKTSDFPSLKYGDPYKGTGEGTDLNSKTVACGDVSKNDQYQADIGYWLDRHLTSVIEDSMMPAPRKRQRLTHPHPVRETDSDNSTILTPIGQGKTVNWTSEEVQLLFGILVDIRPSREHPLEGQSKHGDEVLRHAVAVHKARNWKLIAEALPNRTDVQCLHRWQKVLNPILVKGYWTKEEDERMIELVEMFGKKRWAAIARCLPGRNGKQCRERWCNHLDPRISRAAWTEAEDMVLFLAHAKFGNKWAEISKFLPGRSDNGIKNRWNTSVKKKAREMEQCTKSLDLQSSVLHGDSHLFDSTADRPRDGQVELFQQDENCACFQSFMSSPPVV